ncbi:hypothetical protein INT43_000949 [Umbelopsis isabellina]|uniref:Uncharacterized protein n=1 Tax=Mortierella isabellina TaxID=91625 RepID=A0A8H7Q3A6_MORIS|nr:hypothetical protein INT43_000949 [Umbelopsis isabellina]
MKRRGPPPPGYAPPYHGHAYGGPPRDWDGPRPYGRRGDYLPPDPRPYKRGKPTPIPSPKPVRKDFFEFRLEKLIIGEYSADTGENNDGEDRLRFYLKDSNNNDSKPDSIALTVKDGQQRIVIDASNIKTIELLQKIGHFKFTIDGNYKIEKLENANFVECEEDPTDGQLSNTETFECYVDKKNPITTARETEPNIKNWSSASSRFREILQVLDADAPRTLDDVINEWAKTSPIGLPSERLLFAKMQLKKGEKLTEIITTLAHEESSVGPAVDMLLKNFKQLAEDKMSQEELNVHIKSMIMAMPESAIAKSLDIIWAIESEKV